MNSNTETREIEGFPDYEVTSDGRVWSKPRIVQRRNQGPMPVPGRWLKPGIGTDGYHHLQLSRDGKPLTRRVHALVAAAFIGPRAESMQIDHIDRDKLNNHASNLRYVTRRENLYNTAARGCAKSRSGRWEARVMREGKFVHLGTYATEHEAHQAYLDAKASILEQISPTTT